MSFTRKDLLELGFDALVALANAGFVKKAQKDIEAGLIPEVEELVDGTVKAVYADGVTTTLAPERTLREANCSCPASNLCRHRVMLVMAYQHKAKEKAGDLDDLAESNSDQHVDVFWSPADFSDEQIKESFSSSTLLQAEKILASMPSVVLEQWSAEQPIPSARLPMCTVRFFSKSAIVHARCDCKEGAGCAHVVVALNAFKEARKNGIEKEGTRQTIELLPVDSQGNSKEIQSLFAEERAQSTQQNIQDWIQKLWDDGIANAFHTLEADISPILSSCDKLGWQWVKEEIIFIAEQIKAQQGRSSRFDPFDLLRSVSNLWARIQAANFVDKASREPDYKKPPLPARQILGIGVKGEVALDHLKLVSLGMQLWSEKKSDSASENTAGVNVVFVDTDTQTLMQFERSWQIKNDIKLADRWQDCLNRRVAGQPLRLFANSQVVTKAASRKANGLLELSANSKQSNFFPLSPSSWDGLLYPIKQTNVEEFAKYLADRLPEFVIPFQSLKAFHVFSPEEMLIDEISWDAAKQTLYAKAYAGDSEDCNRASSICLALPYNELTPQTIDCAVGLYEGREGTLKAISGTVWLEDGQIMMQPWAILTNEKAVVLEVSESKLKATQLDWQQISVSAQNEVITGVLNMLALWLRQGIRHQSQSTIKIVNEQIAYLQGNGFLRCAQKLKSINESFLGKFIPLPQNELIPLALTLFELAQGNESSSND